MMQLWVLVLFQIYRVLTKQSLVPLLTAALQEAIAKIETLETKVAQLEAE